MRTSLGYRGPLCCRRCTHLSFPLYSCPSIFIVLCCMCADQIIRSFLVRLPYRIRRQPNAYSHGLRPLNLKLPLQRSRYRWTAVRLMYSSFTTLSCTTFRLCSLALSFLCLILRCISCINACCGSLSSSESSLLITLVSFAQLSISSQRSSYTAEPHFELVS